jgi:hypothetical protein
MQGGGGIQGPTSAAPGATIEVTVQGSASEIEVGMLGSPDTTILPVGTDRKVRVTLPTNVEEGFFLITTRGKPPLSGITVQIVSPH